MEFTIYQGSVQGGRAVNQDRYAYTYGRDTLLLVAADGMGGHVGGEVAAQICVRLVVERFHQEAKPVLRRPGAFLRDTLARVHDALISYAYQVSAAETPRTTCVACVVQAGHAYWAHAGDSRLYLFRGERLRAETRDHTRVRELAERGVIDYLAADTHPERSRVFSCLGGYSAPTIDVGPPTELAEGDLIVLSTDGFWSMIKPEEIVRALSVKSVVIAAPLLLREAERRGGPGGDNATVIAVRWGPEVLTNAPDATITEALPQGKFETHLGRAAIGRGAGEGALVPTDEEIDRAIAEIRAKIER